MNTFLIVLICLFISFVIQTLITWGLVEDYPDSITTNTKILFLIPGIGLVTVLLIGIVNGISSLMKDIFKEELKKKR